MFTIDVKKVRDWEDYCKSKDPEENDTYGGFTPLPWAIA